MHQFGLFALRDVPRTPLAGAESWMARQLPASIRHRSECRHQAQPAKAVRQRLAQVALVAATTTLAGCAIVTTERVGSSTERGGSGSAGVPYMLPKALLPIELVVSGGAIRIDVLEPVFVGDPDQLHVLRYGANAFSNDTVKIEVDSKTSLLKTVTLESKDETGEVLKKAIALGVRAESAVGSDETVLLQTVLDPSNPAAFIEVQSELNAAITSYVLSRNTACKADPKADSCASIAALPNGGDPKAAVSVNLLASDASQKEIRKAVADCSIGICQRAMLPYQVKMSLFGQTRSTHVLLPNGGAPIALALDRHALVTTKHTVVLRNGIVESYETTKPSSALAIVSWPLDVYDAVVSTTAKIIQLKIDTSRNALSLEEQLLAEAKKRKEIEEELEKLKSPKAESATLIGMGGSRALLTVGTGRPPRATPAQDPGFKNQAPPPSTAATPDKGGTVDPNAPAKKLPGSDGKGG